MIIIAKTLSSSDAMCARVGTTTLIHIMMDFDRLNYSSTHICSS